MRAGPAVAAAAAAAAAAAVSRRAGGRAGGRVGVQTGVQTGGRAGGRAGRREHTSGVTPQKSCIVALQLKARLISRRSSSLAVTCSVAYRPNKSKGVGGE